MITVTIDKERLKQFEAYELKKGGHKKLAEGMCVMEAAAWIAREPWSDKTKCVSRVLGAFLRSWNDSLDDATRQKLKPYAARVVGTANDGHDEWRAWLCVDWLARTQLPVWLDLAELQEHAAAVRALIAISTPESASLAQTTLAAARAAAWDAAGDAAGATVRAAAWDAAGAAAGEAAGAAVRAAVRAAAGDAVWDAVRAAVRSAAWAAAGDAVRSAAWAALEPSVLALQASAFTLLDRMIEGPRE